MRPLPDSFIKVNYPFRPSKQVERKLLVELFHQLSTAVPGYDIREYTYVGFGSVYYTDFVLFHKYLYMDRMICVEGSDIPNRMEFNRPYDFIELRMARFREVIQEFQRDRPYLMWLDYDTGLTKEELRDVQNAIQVLPNGSIFLVTVDAEARLPHDPLASQAQLRKRAVSRLREDCGNLYPERIELRHFTQDELPTVLATIIRNQIEGAAHSRGETEFAQLVNFRYKDGAQMVSLGGVVDSPERVAQLRESSVMGLQFVNDSEEPLPISVPHLTLREKLWLDQNAATVTTAFELEEGMLENFRAYRRYYPSYHEALL